MPTKLKILINSKTSGKFKREIIDGRSHLVTTMMPIRGDITMNNIFYPDQEVTNSFMQLNMLPAPNGHPVVNGVSVPAWHPVANNKHNIGGFLRNPRKKGKRVFVDFLLDEEIANNSDAGKETIKRIESGERLGVSTGLSIAQVINKTGTDDFGKGFTREGKGFQFDHVATLLNEEAAGAHAGTELILNEKESEVLIYNAGDTFDKNSPEEIIDLIQNVITDNSQEDYKVKFDDGVFLVENKTQPINKEVDEMDKNKLVLAIIGNSANNYTVADNDSLTAMSDDALLKIVATNIDDNGAKAILTNSGFDFAGYDDFLTNKAEFDLYLKDRAEVSKAAIDNIVANSEYTPEMLKGKSMNELDLINNMLAPEKIAVRASEQGHKIIVNTADNAVVDYS